jgi:hypothetical protein
VALASSFAEAAAMILRSFAPKDRFFTGFWREWEGDLSIMARPYIGEHCQP